MRLGIAVVALALFAGHALAQEADAKISVSDLKAKIAELGPAARAELSSAYRSALEDAREGTDKELVEALEKRVRAFLRIYKDAGVYSAATDAEPRVVAEAAECAAALNEKQLLEEWATAFETRLDGLKKKQDAAKAERDAAPKDAAKQTALDAAVKQVSEAASRVRQILDPLRTVGLGDRADALAALLHAATGELTDLSVGAALGMAERAWTSARTWVEENAVTWAVKFVLIILIYFVFKFVARFASRITNAALSRSKISPSELLRKFFVGLVSKLVMFLGILVILGQLGIDIGPFLAGVGVVGFIVGFALQDTLANFAAGVMILLYRPFDRGDVINACGIVGKVDNLTLVSTTMLTPDNQVHVVPNKSVWGGVITNITANSTRRVDMVIGVGYGDDLDGVQALLLDEVKKHPLVLESPEPQVAVSELADSSVNFVVRPWCKTSDYWAVKFDLSKSIKQRIDAEGYNIPFPQRDVHIHQQAAD